MNLKNTLLSVTWLIVLVSANIQAEENYTYMAFSNPIPINSQTKPTPTAVKIAQVRAQLHEELEQATRKAAIDLYKRLLQDLSSIDQERIKENMIDECPSALDGTQPQNCQKCLQLMQTLISYASPNDKGNLNSLLGELYSHLLNSEKLRAERKNLLHYLDTCKSDTLGTPKEEKDKVL